MRKILMLLGFMLFGLILSGCEEGVTFVVSFETNGGNLISSVRFNGKSELKLPDDPIKDGYLFDGWYLDEALEEPLNPRAFLSTPVTEGFTLYAKWIVDDTRETFDVTFETLDGHDPTTIAVFMGDPVVSPDVNRDGYHLEGWYLSLDEGLTFDQRWDVTSDVVTKDVILYANWILNQYSVTFHDAYGVILETIIVNHGDSAETSLEPLKTATSEYSFVFAGWDHDLSIITSDLDVHPIYQEIIHTYTVTFDGDGGTLISGDEVQTIEHGSPATAPVYEKEGFDLSWDRIFNDVITSDLTVTANGHLKTIFLSLKIMTARFSRIDLSISS